MMIECVIPWTNTYYHAYAMPYKTLVIWQSIYFTFDDDDDENDVNK